MEPNARVVVEVVPIEADQALSQRLTTNLRRELELLDTLTEVEQSTGKAVEGAKGLDPSTTYIVITLATAAISGLVAVLTAWLRRSEARSVKLTMDGEPVELNGLSAADQHAIVEALVSRRQLDQGESD